MKQAGTIRKPYTGQKKAIVIALDVGTTFSGVSYALLDPGEIPKIYEVTRFPGQEHQAGNPKIPSVIWYDRHGDAVKAGAEAEEQSNVNTAEEQGWTKVELFKLRLRPKSMKLDMNGMKLPHLPKSKSALEVFGDFLKYLFRCTRSFIVETHAGGASVWKTVENDIQFILSHPNGWEGAQQSKMRKAAIYSGLVPNTDEGKARVRFVTEGEASLHACVLNGLADDVLSSPSRHGFVVADAGGGTLDISSYAIKGTAPLLIEEIAPPDCLFSGSVFVSRRARKFLEQKLNGSAHYGAPAMLDHITKRFDETTKRLFRSRSENQYLHFGSPLDKDPSVGIRSGKLKLTGDEVADLFEPSIEAAVAAIRNQVVLSGDSVKSVWLVGGFASSPWLFTQLQERLEPDGIVVSRPDGQTSKAVANGAIGFYCDHHVGARIAKYMYGVEFLREFDAADPEHVDRQSRLFQLPSGPKLLPDAFDCILARNSRVKESTTFSRKYCTELTSLSTLAVFEIEIWCYRGPGEQPKWILRGQDDFSTLCFVRADLSPLTASAKAMTGPGGKKYWTIVFSIEIHFGLTEFKARIKWTDDGKVKYGPASIVYDEGGNKELEDDRDSQDEISAIPPSRYGSRAPSMAPSRTHSASNTPQTVQSPVEERSTVGTMVGTSVSRNHSTSQSPGDRHPEGYADSSVSKKSKSSGSHHRSSSQQLSPNPSNVSHHTSRSERSQHSPNSSQHPSQHSASPRELPRDISRLSPAPREIAHPTISQPVSREPSQLGQQTIIVTPTSTAPSQHHDREILRSGRQTPNYYASTPTQSHVSQPQQPSPLPSILGENTSSISRTHGRSRSIVTATQPPESTGVMFPSVSSVGSPSEVAVPRSAIQSRTTSLTPSDSASNIHVNYLYGNGGVPGTIPGSVVGPPAPETTVSKKSKKDKNRSLLSTIASATTKPPTEQLQPIPEPVPSIPQISIPASPSVSSSISGSRLTTKPNTPINTRSLKTSLASSLSYATDRPEQPAPQPTSMSRQNSDSVVAGGLGSALGGVLSNVWGSYKSTNASPIENPLPGPATAAFEATLEPIMDVEVPGGFGGERDREAPVPPQEEFFEPVVVPPSPEKFEELEPPKLPTPRTEIADLPIHQPTETVPQTPNPNEPEQSVLSAADKKKNKKQREKERKDKEAQEKKEREEQERLEREAQEKRDLEEREEKKRQKAEREARRKKEREEREEQERLEQERIEREALEQAKREAEEQAARQAKEQADREARERAERIEQAEREAREARARAEREAKEEAERAAKEKTSFFKKRSDREAARKEAEEKAKREAKERADEAARVKAERDRKKAEKEAAEREAREKAKQEEAERIAREKAELEAKEREKAEREAKEKAEERERFEREERERLEKEERERLEKEEKERAENEAKKVAEREAKEREEAEKEAKAEREAKEREEAEKKKSPPSKLPSAWGSTVGKNSDRSRTTSGLSQKEKKNGWADTWDSGFTQKDESSGLPPIITSSVPGGIFEGAGHLEFFANIDSPGGAGGGEEVELRTPLTKRGKGGIKTPSNLPKGKGGITPLETMDLGKFDILEQPGTNNMSARASVSSENERFTDAEQDPSPTETAYPILAAPVVVPEAFSNSTSELLSPPRGAKEEAPTTPKPWPAPSLDPIQFQVPNPAPAPVKNEPEKPLSLWERKKPKSVSPAQPSGLFSGGDSTNSSGVWGNDGGGNTEAIAMPALSGTGGDRQSVFTDTARDQKRENQRENLVEGFLGSTQPRKRNDSAQSQITAKSTPKPGPVPVQKASGWGSWGSSLLTNLSNVVATDRSPSPEPAPVRPKIEDPPRGFTPNQPPKSQPAGFGSVNKPAWGAGGGLGDKPAWGGGGSGDNAWGGTKNVPAITQKTSTGPAWGAKPTSGGFGTSVPTWGNNAGSTFASGVGKNLKVDTSTKPLESSPNTAGPENIPESAIEIKHVPAPGLFRSSVTDLEKEQEQPAEAQGDSWGWEESGKGKGSKEKSKEASPVEAKLPEESHPEQPIPTEGTQETAETEGVVIPAENEEDEFGWAGPGKKKKKGQAASVAQTPSVPNTPDVDNADDGVAGGGGTQTKKKKKKGGKRP